MIDMVYIYALFCLWAGLICVLSLVLSRRVVQNPNLYLGFIFTVFAPFIIAVSLKSISYNPATNLTDDILIMSTLSAAAETGRKAVSSTMIVPIFWGLYTLIAGGLALRICLSLRRLWAIGPIEAGLIISADVTDPACLPWPRRAVLLPQGLTGEARQHVLAHERAHQKYYDAEVTLGLCLLGAVFWLNRPLVQLIKHWRFAIELRADATALSSATMHQRKDYAALLLQHITTASQNGSRNSHHGGTRPCPSMALIPDQKRRTEMRLKSILTLNPRRDKRAWLTRVAVIGLCLAGLGGGLGLSALAADDQTPAAEQNNAALMRFVKRVPPRFPQNCIPKENPPIVKTIPSGTGFHGWVKVKYNIDNEGIPFNITVTESSKSCFESHSIAAVKQWRYEPVTVEPGGARTRTSEMMLGFIQTPEE